MIVYKLGRLIRAARESGSISQEKLAVDVCSTQTLSRLENGRSMVGRDKYLKLLERVGMKENMAGAFAESGCEAFELRRRFERAVIERKNDEARALLERLKRFDNGDDEASGLYIRNAEEMLAFRLGELSADSYVNYIRASFANVDRAFVNGSADAAALTHPEQFMLVEMAGALHGTGHSLCALSLLESMRYSASETYLRNSNYMNPLIIALATSARILYDLKRFREAAVTCDDLLAMCSGGSYFVPEALMIKAMSIEASEGGLYLANEVAAMKKRAYYLALAVGDDVSSYKENSPSLSGKP